MSKNFLRISVLSGLCGLIFALSVFAQTKIPAPKDVLGFTPGEDRKLASWAQTIDYFKKLDAASDRVIFEEIGKTTLGKPFVYATISSPKNLKNLKSYKWINEQLADPRKFKSVDLAARRFIKDGKTIVLITCGIHSTEVGSYLSSMLIAERLAAAADPETQKILDETIVLLVPSLNPDGVDIVKNWYDKTLGTPFEGTDPPELYHKYVGHDNNRDWYAFTQVETQLTVDKIHNAWHPQIVHDIHQQGAFGARLFLPPYMVPVEPNVPRQIVEGFTELGSFMADDLRKKGLQGITTNTTYDAWTPARAYSHYHGGVRILSETASARIASPVTIKFEDLRGASGGLDAKKESPNFSPVWKGGEWKLKDITNYMTTGAFSLLKHASDNREKWLSRFYSIGKEATRPRKGSETAAYIIPDNERYNEFRLRSVLERGGVEIEEVEAFEFGGRKFKSETTIVRLDQPYGNFVKALVSPTIYPNLLDESGQPINPYDVTAHNLSMLFGAEVIPVPASFKFRKSKPKQQEMLLSSPIGAGRKFSNTFTVCIYKSFVPSMDEGWTRWVLEDELSILSNRFPYSTQVVVKSITNPEINDNLFNSCNRIIFPDQSQKTILEGYEKDQMPLEYVGGLKGKGVENLKQYLEKGGAIIFLNQSSDFAIEQFNLPVKNVVKGLSRKDFFVPGSILRIKFDAFHPIATLNSKFADSENRSWNQLKESIAWFENSPAFEIKTDPLALANNFRIIASYPKNANEILLSGWALGAEKLAGKAALVEFTLGKGKIILFGFRPQYRGQSLATFPLLFNAIGN